MGHKGSGAHLPDLLIGRRAYSFLLWRVLRDARVLQADAPIVKKIANTCADYTFSRAPLFVATTLTSLPQVLECPLTKIRVLGSLLNRQEIAAPEEENV